MTARMSPDEVIVLIDEVRANRADIAARKDASARALLLVDAARTALDDTIVGDPHEVVGALAAVDLTYRHRMRWFATLIEAVGDADRFIAWRARTAGQHHAASDALEHCIDSAVDRAALAAGALLYGTSAMVA